MKGRALKGRWRKQLNTQPPSFKNLPLQKCLSVACGPFQSEIRKLLCWQCPELWVILMRARLALAPHVKYGRTQEV